MSSRPELVVDWCSYAAAKYAVEHWHYSGVMPAGKLGKLGVWEGGAFVGVVLFGWGANNNIGSPYALKQTEVCELVRIALRDHYWPVSKIARLAIKDIHNLSPGVRLVVSYADPEQGHNGAIYQAMNWIYVGSSKPQRELRLNGRIVHKKSGHSKFKGSISGIPYGHVQWKHKYLYPLDRAMRRQIAPLAQPYPKRLDAPPANGGDLATSQAGRFNPDPEAS